MDIEKRRGIERRIVKKAVEDLIACGYMLSVNNGGDEDELVDSSDVDDVLSVMFAADEDTIYAKREISPEKVGWVHFVYGNDGHDVIQDYTVDLVTFLSEAEKLADQIAEGKA